MTKDECPDIIHKHKTDQVCMAVYAVPDGARSLWPVDGCWKGPHVTVAGFYPYTPADMQALRIPGASEVDLRATLHDIAASGHGSEWHLKKGAEKGLSGPTKDGIRKLSLGQNEHGTFALIQDQLERKHFKKVKHAGDLHVSFDNEKCAEGSLCFKKAKEDLWDGAKRAAWHLYPVIIDDISEKDCRDVNNAAIMHPVHPPGCPAPDDTKDFKNRHMHYCHSLSSGPILSGKVSDQGEETLSVRQSPRPACH